MFNSKTYLLKDLAEIQSGYSMRGSIPEDPDGNIAIVQMKDTDRLTGICWDNLIRINQVSKREPNYLKEGDVIFTGRGTSIFATPVNVKPEKVVASQQFFVLSPMNRISAIYLSWFINSTIAQKYFWKHAGGSAIVNVNRNVLENLPVPLPSNESINIFSDLIHVIHKEDEFHKQLVEKRNKLIESILVKSLENI